MDENPYMQTDSDTDSHSNPYTDSYADSYTQITPYGQGSSGGNAQETPAISIVGLILGIMGIVVGCCYGVGIVLAVPGLICSIIGNNKRANSVGIAGIVCSVVGIVISVLMIVFVGAIIGSLFSWFF